MIIASLGLLASVLVGPLMRLVGGDAAMVVQATNASNVMRWGLIGFSLWQVCFAVLAARQAAGWPSIFTMAIDVLSFAGVVLFMGDSVIEAVSIAHVANSSARAIVVGAAVVVATRSDKGTD